MMKCIGFALCLALSACGGGVDWAKVTEQLKGDGASVCITVQSIYFTTVFARANGGTSNCGNASLSGGTSPYVVVVQPNGSAPASVMTLPAKP